MSKHLEARYAFLLKDAHFTPDESMPIFQPVTEIPERIIPFSKAKRKDWHDYDCWICFYENDEKFEELWNSPSKYLMLLKRYRGIIMPDFSLPLDAPACYQYFQIFRSRALSAYFQANGIRIIPNIRYANVASHQYFCAGIPENSVIAVGTLGCLRDKEKRKALIKGLAIAVDTLHPSCILVYGGTPDDIFQQYRLRGISIIRFIPDNEAERNKKRQEKIKAITQQQQARQGTLFQLD